VRVNSNLEDSELKEGDLEGKNKGSGRLSHEPVHRVVAGRFRSASLQSLPAAAKLFRSSFYVGAPFSAYPFEPSPLTRTPKKERPLHSISTIAPLP